MTLIKYYGCGCVYLGGLGLLGTHRVKNIKLIEYYNNLLPHNMATVPLKNLQPHEVAELACTYAALILHDEDIDINGTGKPNSAKKIEQLIHAAGVNVEAFWPKLFAKALEGRNVADFFAVGGDSAAHDDGHHAAAGGAAAKEPAKKEESNL